MSVSADMSKAMAPSDAGCWLKGKPSKSFEDLWASYLPENLRSTFVGDLRGCVEMTYEAATSERAELLAALREIAESTPGMSNWYDLNHIARAALAKAEERG